LETLTVSRDRIVAAMEAENIGVGIHYQAVHTQPFWVERFGRDDSKLPNATKISERTISLPLSAGMSDEDAVDVCRALARVLRYYAV